MQSPWKSFIHRCDAYTLCAHSCLKHARYAYINCKSKICRYVCINMCVHIISNSACSYICKNVNFGVLCAWHFRIWLGYFFILLFQHNIFCHSLMITIQLRINKYYWYHCFFAFFNKQKKKHWVDMCIQDSLFRVWRECSAKVPHTTDSVDPA